MVLVVPMEMEAQMVAVLVAGLRLDHPLRAGTILAVKEAAKEEEHKAATVMVGAVREEQEAVQEVAKAVKTTEATVKATAREELEEAALKATARVELEEATRAEEEARAQAARAEEAARAVGATVEAWRAMGEEVMEMEVMVMAGEVGEEMAMVMTVMDGVGPVRAIVA
jgi:hypothetical protein